MKNLQKMILFLFLLIIFPTKHNFSKALKRNPDNQTYYLRGKYHDVIFPGYLYNSANRLMNNLEYFLPYYFIDTNLKLPRLPVIIYNKNANNNGAVETYPRRMHFNYHQTQTRDINLNLDWIDLVSLHESRHTIQNQYYYNEGPSRFLTKMIGIRFPIFEIPDWFSEGDAVFKETALSNGGRGRSPIFSMLFKYMVLENKSYSYQKVLYNSNVKKIPDAYVLGYHLVSYLRKKYGKNIIDNIIKKTASLEFCFTYFDMIVHSETKRFMSDIYNDMVVDLKKKWSSQVIGINNLGTSTVYQNKDNDYFYPQFDDENNIVAVKSSLDDLNCFVKIKNGKEKVLFYSPYIESGNIFSISKNLVTWSCGQVGAFDRESIFYSNIKVYNTKTKKIKQLTKKGIFRAPSLSNDAKKIVAVKSDFKGKHFLQILDSSKGKLLKSFNNFKNVYYLTPSWSKDDTKIICIKFFKNLNALVSIDINTEEETILIDYTEDFLSHPKDFEDYVFFESNYNGIYNIYAIDKETKEIFKVTDAKYGSMNPSMSKDYKFFIYNNFKKGGLTIEKMKIKHNNWQNLDKVKDRRVYLFTDEKLPSLNMFKKSKIILKNISDKNKEHNIINTIPNKKYRKKKYSKLDKIFYLHSLPIWPLDLETELGNPALTVKLKSLSINKNFRIESSFSKFFLNQKNYTELQIDYTNIFPSFRINFSYELNNLSKYKNELNKLEENPYINFEQITLKRKELQFLRQYNKIMRITPQLYFKIESILNNGFISFLYYDLSTSILYDFKLNHGQVFIFMPFSLTWDINRFLSKKDISPKWGNSFSVHYKNFLKNGNIENSEIFLKIHNYLPGILKHHSLQFITAIRYRTLKREVRESMSTFSKFLKMKKQRYNPLELFTRLSPRLLNLHVIYEFPLVFLDFPLYTFAYLKQLNIKLFGSSYLDFLYDKEKNWFQPYIDSIGCIFSFPDIGILRISKFNISFSLGLMYSFSKERLTWGFDLYSNLLEES